MKWTCIEPGVYHLGPYLVRKKTTKVQSTLKQIDAVTWVVSKYGNALATCGTLNEAKRHAEHLHGRNP